LEIHLTFFTYEEFLSMAQSREFSVVLEAIKNNIILVGIEDYYRLMENVR
ncbi:MAG: nucleotidyltransferase, partial [Euryarchaeota archaeon]|nr:nucleotidyltransferase [Euryarchaeota archaeon]